MVICNYFVTILFVLLGLWGVVSPAEAVNPVKIPKGDRPIKERLVLMPIRVNDTDSNLEGAMESALVEGMQQKYEVFSGEQVAKRAHEIFLKESRATAKKECDETRCMQDIGIAFQAELIAIVNVTKQETGYFLALSIQNIFDNKVVYSKSIPCKNCDAYRVVEILKDLGSGQDANAFSKAFSENREPITLATPFASKANDSEGVLWAEVQNGNVIDDYDAYLEQFPNGKFAALAKNRIKKLKEEISKDANRNEQEMWFKAESGKSKVAVEAYISRYPAGRYIEEAKAKLGLIKLEEASLPVMVRIPGKNYEIGKYHVTRGEFAKFVSETNYDAGNQCHVWSGTAWSDKNGYNWRNVIYSQDDTHPVVCVNWNDAQAYVAWLSNKTGQQYRLPNEFEWEYACYGGNKTEYCGGGDINAVAWYKDNSGGMTHPVGHKQANGYGLYDMSGNAWQWMENWYDSNQSGHALRGGSWLSIQQDIRAVNRIDYDPALRNESSGFRVVRTLP